MAEFSFSADVATVPHLDWMADFQSPPVEYRPVPFWSWNEWMEPQEVARQVRLMKEAGWGGAFIHARMGLLTPYLGEDWFKACEATLEACREQGLIAWLYDEDKWPSGFSGGSVPLADANFRHKSLIARPTHLPSPPDCTPLGKASDGVQVYRWVSPLGDSWFNGTCYTDLLSRDAMQCFLGDAYEPYFARFGEQYGSLIVAQFTDEPCSSYRSRLPLGAIPYTDELPLRFEARHGYDPLPHLTLLFGQGTDAERFRLHYYQTISELFEQNFSAQLGQWCDAHGIALTGHYILEGSLYHQMLWGTHIMPHYRHQGIPGIDHLGRQIEERITAKQCQSVANQYGKRRVLSELYGVAGGGLSFEDRWWIATQQITLGVNLLNPHLSLYTMAGCRKRDYPQNIFYQQPWWPLNAEVDEPLSRLCLALSQGQYNAEIAVLHPGESAFVLWEATHGNGDETLERDWEPVTQVAQDACHALDRDLKALTDTLLGAQRTFDFVDEAILRDVGAIEFIGETPRLRVGQMSYPLVILPSLETIEATTLELLRELQNNGGTVLRCGRAPRLLDGSPSAELEAWLESVPLLTSGNLAQELKDQIEPIVEVQHIHSEAARLLWTHTRELDNGGRLVWLVNLSRVLDFEVTVQLSGDWEAIHELDLRSGDEVLLASRTSSVRLSFARTQGHLLYLAPREMSPHLNGAPGNGTYKGEQTTIAYPVLAEALQSLEWQQFQALLGDNGPRSHSDDTKSEDATSRALKLDVPASLWSVERLDDNALTLDYAYWKVAPNRGQTAPEGNGNSGEWSERAMPVLAIQDLLNEAHYEGPLTLAYTVSVGELSPTRKVHLVVERPENYRISVNGVGVSPSDLEPWRDIRWIPLDITGLLRAGGNRIELECPQFRFGDLNETHDQPARYGTEIESIYLVGDFAVPAQLTGEEPRQSNWKHLELPPVAVRCAAHESLCLREPEVLRMGDVIPQGLPFYAGRLRFSMPLPRVDGALRVLLEMTNLDGAIAEVTLNSEPIGTIWAHPLALELPVAALDGGELSIVLYGTLRNLLGPHHHAQGELVMVGPEHFKPHRTTRGNQESYASWFEAWMKRQQEPLNWSDRYCLLSFGDLGTVTLTYR